VLRRLAGNELTYVVSDGTADMARAVISCAQSPLHLKNSKHKTSHTTSATKCLTEAK